MGPVAGAWRRRAPLAVGIAFLLLYGASAARTVQAFDSGELVAVARTWGVAHPPGFPTFVLLAGAFLRLVPAGAAHSVALWSALMGALACGLCVAWLLELGASVHAAVLAAAIWGALPETWALHTGQEPFATAHAFLALVLFLCARPSRWGFALGVTSGLGAGAHALVVWAAPVVAARLFGDAKGGRARPLLRFAAGLLLSLPIFGTLAFGWRGHGLRWGEDTGLGGIVSHALRSDYGVLSFGLLPGSASLTLRHYARHVVWDGLGLFPALVAAGWLLALRSRRQAMAAIACAQALATFVFLGMLHAPQGEWSRDLVARFFSQADLYALPFLCLSVDALRDPARGFVARAARLLLPAWAALLAAQGATWGVSAGRDAIARSAADALESVRPGAVLVSGADTMVGALWEAQLVRNIRPDVAVVASGLLAAPWYAERVRLATGYAHPGAMEGMSLLLLHAIEAGRPVYVAETPRGALPRRFHFVPEGVVLRVLPLDRPPPAARTTEVGLAAFFAAHPPPRLPGWMRPRASERAAFEAYARPWRALLGVYAAAGDRQGTERCRARIHAAVP
jgi:transmembrane protein TMEM260 (protein O-mannosyltransferase)